jgi:hypothetical protein
MLPSVWGDVWTVLMFNLVGIDAAVAIVVDVNTVMMPIPIIPAPKYADYADADPTEGSRYYGVTGKWSKVDRRIVGIGPRAIGDSRVVYWHIHDFWISRLYYNRLVS